MVDRQTDIQWYIGMHTHSVRFIVLSYKQKKIYLMYKHMYKHTQTHNTALKFFGARNFDASARINLQSSGVKIKTNLFAL